MELFTILLIALSLAMDAFAVSISNGIRILDFGRADAFKQGIYFGAFQFIMPIVGWFLGTSVRGYIEAVDHWIAFFLLVLIGGNMIWESMKKEDVGQERKKILTSKELMIQAIATSIDALAVGISFAVLDVSIISASMMIGLVAFALSFIGGYLGKGLGGFLQKKTEFAGGGLLILIGIKVLIEHLFY